MCVLHAIATQRQRKWTPVGAVIEFTAPVQRRAITLPRRPPPLAMNAGRDAGPYELQTVVLGDFDEDRPELRGAARGDVGLRRELGLVEPASMASGSFERASGSFESQGTRILHWIIMHSADECDISFAVRISQSDCLRLPQG